MSEGSASLDSQTILVVDDEESILEILTTGLTGRGFKVISATQAEEALRRIHGKTVDYALIDIRLPKMDGITLSGELKERFPGIITILMTGYPSVNSAVDAVRSHVYDYLIKPFRVEQVIAVIDRARREQVITTENKYMAESIRNLRTQNEDLRSIIDEIGTEEMRVLAKVFEKYRGLNYDKLTVIQSYLQQQAQLKTPPEDDGHDTHTPKTPLASGSKD